MCIVCTYSNMCTFSNTIEYRGFSNCKCFGIIYEVSVFEWQHYSTILSWEQYFGNTIATVCVFCVLKNIALLYLVSGSTQDIPSFSLFLSFSDSLALFFFITSLPFICFFPWYWIPINRNNRRERMQLHIYTHLRTNHKI